MSVDEFSAVHADSLTPPAEVEVKADNIVATGIVLLLIWKVADTFSGMFGFNRYDDSDVQGSYQLMDVPIVYHVLSGQEPSRPGKPTLTELQRNFTTDMTNSLFNIYDRHGSKNSSQFIKFVNNDTIYHSSLEFTGDCLQIHRTKRLMNRIVKSTPEHHFKMHVIICAFDEISGIATFPDRTSSKSPYHNAVLIDYQALACKDDDGNHICEEGQKSRWWRSRSTVVAHELGHSFGL